MPAAVEEPPLRRQQRFKIADHHHFRSDDNHLETADNHHISFQQPLLLRYSPTEPLRSPQAHNRVAPLWITIRPELLGDVLGLGHYANPLVTFDPSGNIMGVVADKLDLEYQTARRPNFRIHSGYQIHQWRPAYRRRREVLRRQVCIA